MKGTNGRNKSTPTKGMNEDVKTVTAGRIPLRKNLLRDVHQKENLTRENIVITADKNDPILVFRCRCVKYPAEGNML